MSTYSEFEVHVGHWSDECDSSVYPIATLARARSAARRLAKRAGQACIWEQTEHGIRFVESWS